MAAASPTERPLVLHVSKLEESTMKKSLWKMLFLSAILLLGPLATAQQARWMETQSWSGRGTSCTAFFLLDAHKCRVRYAPAGKGPFRIEMIDEDGNLVRTLTDQGATRPLRGRKTLSERGRYYLRIVAPGNDWTVRIQQYVSIIEEWHLSQLAKRPPDGWVQLGTWTGGAGEHTYELEFPCSSWQAACTVEGESSSDIGIFDAAGQTWFFAVVAPNTEAAAWIHAAGSFNLVVNSGKATWRVNVFGREK